MTEEIIIDGVNVNECKYFNKVVNEEPYCNIDEEHLYTCSSDENCYFKQLKRLEQENNSLQAQLNNITVQSNNAITALEQENKELKETVKDLNQSIQNCNIQRTKMYKALEEISGLASPHCTQCSQIINIINEVLQ